MQLDIRLERLKTWWCHKVNKKPEDVFYPDIYDLRDHAFDMLMIKHRMINCHIPFKENKEIQKYMNQLKRVLEQEGSLEFLKIFQDIYENPSSPPIFKICNYDIVEKDIPFAGNWRSWGEALRLRYNPSIDNKEFFKNARQNGLHVEEDLRYVALRNKPVEKCFTRKQLNDFFRDKVWPLGKALIHD